MPQTPLPSTLAPSSDIPIPAKRPHVYICCPWTPVGGGMYKIADYLIQAQGADTEGRHAQLQPLDTRGSGSAAASLVVLARAMGRLVRGRLDGRLAGVHVNMAERLSLVRKSAIVALCRLLGVPVVLHLHAAQLHHAYRRFPRPLQYAVRWIFSLPRTVIVLGHASAEFVAQELGVPSSRIEIVINGVPDPVLPRRVPDGTRRVLFVGNLMERKGVSDLLRALADPRLADLPLQATFAGGGDVDGYRAMAARMGLQDRVHFTGWADQGQVAQLLAQADVFVLPSYDEGLPLAILEALATGVAVVCTPVGEIPHVLTDGRDACFVPPGDAGAIAAALERILRDDAYRQGLEENGRALHRGRFSLAQFYAGVSAIHRRHFGVAGAPASPQRSEDARP
jgi:glycosyltransferase involved in cell wall biosynthesis